MKITGKLFIYLIKSFQIIGMKVLIRLRTYCRVKNFWQDILEHSKFKTCKNINDNHKISKATKNIPVTKIMGKKNRERQLLLKEYVYLFIHLLVLFQ